MNFQGGGGRANFQGGGEGGCIFKERGKEGEFLREREGG